MSDGPAVELRPTWINTRFEVADMEPRDSEPLERCVVCEEPLPLVFAAVGGPAGPVLERALCESCGHIAFSRRPTAEWFEGFYRDEFETSGAEPPEPPALDYGPISELLCPLLPGDGAKILDVGCGYGSALRHFRKLGYANLVGVEISDRRVRVARRLGVPIVQSTAEEMASNDELAGEAPFDAAFSWHAFEHVVDPALSLGNIASMLKPDGLLFVSVPNAEAEHLVQMSHYAPHIHSWSDHSLATALHRAGLTVVYRDDSLRLIAQKREGPGPEPPPEPFTRRLRRKFLRDFNMRRRSGRADAVVEWSDYSGSREILEASHGDVVPLGELSRVRRVALPLGRRSERVARRGWPAAMLANATLALDAPAPRLNVVYEPGPAQVWVK